jgi:hypothetical protein
VFVHYLEQSLPDLSQESTLIYATTVKGGQHLYKVIRAHSYKKLTAGDIDAALSLVEEYILKVKAHLSLYPKLKTFLSRLYETKGWLIIRITSQKERSELTVVGIAALEKALGYVESYYIRAEQIILLANLIREGNKTDLTRIRAGAEILEKFLVDSERYYKGCSLINLGQINRARLLLCKFLYEMIKKRHAPYLETSLKIKKILLQAAQGYLSKFYPNGNKWKLEFDLIPNYEVWDKLSWSKLQNHMTDRLLHENSRDIRIDLNRAQNENKWLIRETIYLSAKTYIRLGHHKLAHFLLRMTESYGEQFSPQNELEYTVDMADIEENENLLKSLDRLETVKLKNECIGNEAALKRQYGYQYRLAKLYERIGLGDIANILYNKNEPITSLNKIENHEFDESAIQKLIDLTILMIEKQEPLKLVHSLLRLGRRLMIASPEEISSTLAQFNNLIRNIKEFINAWIRYSEQNTLIYNAHDNLVWLQRDSTHYAGRIFAFAVDLCSVYCHALLPKALYFLSKCQLKINDPSWAETMVSACIEAVQFGDPQSFFLAITKIREILEQSESGTNGCISDESRSKLFKGTIVLCEQIIERVVFQKERAKFIAKIAPYVDLATFGLMQLNTENKESWIFRGANILKSRALTGLRLELPRRADFEEKGLWLKLKETLIKENELLFRESDKDEIEDESLCQEKYDLFFKIDKWGLGGCSPNSLRNCLAMYADKKICVLSYLLRGGKLLVTGISNYGKPWVIETIIERSVKELVICCWEDIEFETEKSTYLEEAFAIFIEPLLDHIKEAELLYIIPDIKLYNLPFHALLGSIDKKKQFLIERFEIAYVPSPLILTHLLKSTDQKSGETLAFSCLSEDIGWTEKKSQLLEIGITISDQPYKGYQELQKHNTRDILYIIGHGYFPQENGNPFDASLRLMEFDGTVFDITAREFLHLGPKARFIFLNSCWLAQGETYGRDMYGFPFSIIGAANASCLVSAIRVDVSFAHFFAKELFTNIFQGVDRSTVVAKITRECIQSTSCSTWRLPSFWAPYFFYGDYRPL